MARFIGGRPVLDEESVRVFFDRRAKGIRAEDGHASTVFTDRDSAEMRHQAEAQVALPFLDLPSKAARVLDVGCGAGRWAKTLFSDPSKKPQSYLGFDFSGQLIELAQSQDLSTRAHFLRASVSEFLNNTVTKKCQFSHILVVAVVMYINDALVSSLLRFASTNLMRNGLLYLREGTMTTGKRLTLIEEPSTALGQPYTAVYRTPDEYIAMIQDAGLKVIRSELMLGPHFHRHSDTRHRYFICKNA